MDSNLHAMSEIEFDYHAAGFSASLGFGMRAALIVVDAVRAYTDPASPLYISAGSEVAAMVRLVESARGAAVPLYMVRMAERVSGSEPSVLEQKVPALALLLEGTTAEFIEGLEPIGSDVIISKTGASAFFGTDLRERLSDRAVDTCLIVGFSTSGCVRATAVDAVQHGLRPMVVGDATADRATAPKAASLFDLGAKYADIVTEAEAIALITRQART